MDDVAGAADLRTIRIHDCVSAPIVPMVVVVHALTPVASRIGWVMTQFDGVGDNITALDPEGALHLGTQADEGLVKALTWHWIERLSRVVDDLFWLELQGNDIRGMPLKIVNHDSSWWEITGSSEVRALVEQRFDATELDAD